MAHVLHERLKSKDIKENREKFKPGTYIGKYKIIKLIGRGGYGDVYKVKADSHQILALKTEYISSSKKALEKEIEILKLLDDPSFPQLLDHGTTDNVMYIVMPVYGISISEYRKGIYSKIIPPKNLLMMAYDMLTCIEKLHKKGMIHRDIKPSNFLMQFDENHPLCLIDYGLTRKFIDSEANDHIPPNPLPHFGGTKRYSSLRIHDKKDAAPIDDIYSWFYSIVECWRGNLPWTNAPAKVDIGNLKRDISINELCDTMPVQFRQIYSYILTVGFYDTIDYLKIKNLIVEAQESMDLGSPLNWTRFFRSVNPDFFIDEFEEHPNKFKCCTIA